MKIDQLKITYSYKDKRYDELSDMLKEMNQGDLVSYQENLSKELEECSAKRKNQQKEMWRSRGMIVLGGVLICISPFTAGFLKGGMFALGLGASIAGVCFLKNEGGKSKIYEIKILLLKNMQKEIEREIRGRLSGEIIFNGPSVTEANAIEDEDGREIQL